MGLEEQPWEKLDAASRLRIILHMACIPVQLPTERGCAAKPLSDSSKSRLDGPRLVTEFRNYLVHPSLQKRRKVEKVSPQERRGIYELALLYLALLMLYSVGYDGPYTDRVFGDSGRPLVKMVPWAVAAGRG